MRRLSQLVFVMALFNILPCQASLIKDGGGLVYDTDRDITWLSDANYAKTSEYVTLEGRHVAATDGLMTWPEAKTWAENLVYEGSNGWRLPSYKNPDGSFNTNYDAGWSDRPIAGSEMGHLFYEELGGTMLTPISNSSNPYVSLFKNLGGNDKAYWSGPEYELNSYLRVIFSTKGLQLTDPFNEYYYAWAVHSGNVTDVPEPSTLSVFLPVLWLFLLVTAKQVSSKKFLRCIVSNGKVYES